MKEKNSFLAVGYIRSVVHEKKKEYIQIHPHRPITNSPQSSPSSPNPQTSAVVQNKKRRGKQYRNKILTKETPIAEVSIVD